MSVFHDFPKAAFLAATIITAGCTGNTGTTEDAAAPLRVAVSVPPLAYLVERLGGEHVAVQVVVRGGQDPHTFEPTPRQLATLGKAKLFFQIGLPLETRLLEKIQAPHRRLVVVDVARGIPKRTRRAACRHHAHDHNGDHDDCPAADADPHVWLSPPLLKIQAANIAEALQQADPAGADDYRTNLAALLGEIDVLHARIGLTLKPYRGRAFYVFHPALGYFADAYGLEQKAVEAGGRSPTPQRLRALIKQANADGAKIIFVQPQFNHRGARAVADALNSAVVPIDPLAYDVLKNLDHMASVISGQWSVVRSQESVVNSQ